MGVEVGEVRGGSMAASKRPPRAFFLRDWLSRQNRGTQQLRDLHGCGRWVEGRSAGAEIKSKGNSIPVPGIEEGKKGNGMRFGIEGRCGGDVEGSGADMCEDSRFSARDVDSHTATVYNTGSRKKKLLPCMPLHRFHGS